MSWQTVLDQIKTSTPKRLQFERVTPPANQSFITDVYGTKWVQGTYMELDRGQRSYLSVGEDRDGAQFIRSTPYDPLVAHAAVKRSIDAVETYRQSLGYQRPQGENLVGWVRYDQSTPWPNDRDYPVVPGGTTRAGIDYRKLDSVFVDAFTAWCGYYFDRITKVFGHQVADPIPRGLDARGWYDFSFGGTPAISYEEARLWHENWVNTYINENPNTADGQPYPFKDSQQATAGIMQHLFKCTQRLLQYLQQYLECTAQWEISYYELTKLVGTDELQELTGNLLVASHTKTLTAAMNAVLYGIYHYKQQIENIDTPATVLIAWRELGHYLSFDSFWARTDVVPVALARLHLPHWERDDFFYDLRRIGIAIGEVALRQTFYTGAVGICNGEVNAIHSLAFNDIELPEQLFSEGVNECYYPLMFGGFDNGNGGVGSRDNRSVNLSFGGDSQVILDTATDQPRNPYHYRRVACLTFDKYNLGGFDSPPNVAALVTRIPTDWQPRYATITTTVPDRLPHNLYIVIKYTNNDAKTQQVLQYLQRVCTVQQMVKIGDTILTQQAFQAVDFHSLLWEDSLPASAAEPTLVPIDGIDIDSIGDVREWIRTWARSERLAISGLGSVYTYNPVHMLRLVLIDAYRGFARKTSIIDETSFAIAARTVYTEKLGANFANAGGASADQLFAMLRDYLNAAVYYDNHSDAIKIKLIRADYDVNAIYPLNETNVSQISSYQRNYNVKATSALTLNYRDVYDQPQSVTLTAPNFKATSASTAINYACCPDERTAIEVASRELAIANNSPLSFNVTVSASTAKNFNVGDAVKVSWVAQRIDELVMRVTNIQLQPNDHVVVNLIQEIFIQPTQQLVEEQEHTTSQSARRGWGRAWGRNFGG